MTDTDHANALRRRRLRAVLAADVANFTGLVSVNETNALDALSLSHGVAREELAEHGGLLFGMPGDGIFALFESAVDAVRCALDIQVRVADTPRLSGLRFRIGIHLGDVLFQGDAPFGESLVIAARLEALAEPGGILVSESVREVVAPRISASFSERGVFSLKNSPRRVTAFSVVTLQAGECGVADGLDSTFLLTPKTANESARDIDAPLPRMPKAPQLIVKPNATETSLSPAPSTRPAFRPPLTGAWIDELTLHLTEYLGPVARILVRRFAADHPAPRELVEALAQEIPTVNERRAFMSDAGSVLAREHLI